MEANQQSTTAAQEETANAKSQLEEKMAIIEQRMNDLAKNLGVKADAQADTLVAKWSKQIIDSRFTYLIVGGVVAYFGLSFFICM